MIGVFIENLLSQFVAPPISEKLKLRDFIDEIDEQIGGEMVTAGAARFVAPIPLPDPEPLRRLNIEC